MQTKGRATSREVTIGRRRLALALTVGAVIFLDQFTKLLIRSEMALGAIKRPFGGDFIWIWYVTNPGMAFGVEFLPPLVLIIIKAAAFLGLGYYLFTRPMLPPLQSFPLALIMAGAMGNLIDRLTVGEVVDFISVDLPDALMHRWPTFNIADASVFIGVAILIISNLSAEKADRLNQNERSDDTVQPASASVESTPQRGDE